MQTCELLAVGGNPVLLLAVSGLAGLAIGLGVHLLGAMLESKPARRAVIGDGQRRARRERQGQITGSLLALAPVVGPIARQLPLDSLRDSLAVRYAAAGWPGGLDDDELLGMSLLAGLTLTLPVVFVLGLAQPMIAPLGLVLVIVGPGVTSAILSSRGAQRQLDVSRTMPFVLDLLALTMRAGASLTMAIERAAVDYGQHPIGIEFRGILRDLELGTTIRESLDNLASRMPIPVVKNFVDDLKQAEELGRPISEALERQSRAARTQRMQEAVETTGKAKVMVLAPGVLILMACLILLFSPFVVKYLYGGYVGVS